MPTPWPRPVFPNDYLTATLVPENTTLGVVEGSDFGSSITTISPLESVSLVPGHLYQLDLIGPMNATIVDEPESYEVPLGAYVTVTVDTFDENGDPILTGHPVGIDAFTSFSSTGTHTLLSGLTFGHFYADPTVYAVNSSLVVNLGMSVDDRNGSPAAQIRFDTNDTGRYLLLGIKGVAEDDVLSIYQT